MAMVVMRQVMGAAGFGCNWSGVRQVRAGLGSSTADDQAIDAQQDEGSDE